MYTEESRSFGANKILGGIGSLLSAVGSLSLFSGPIGVVGIIGLILVLIAIKGFSEEYRSYSTYHTALLAFFCGAIGTIIAIIVFAAFDFFSVIFYAHPVVSVVGILGTLLAWVIMFLFLLISGLLFKFTFGILARLSRQSLLRTGSTILLVGAALTIVVVGFVMLFAAWLVIAIGFFSMRTATVHIPSYTKSTFGQTKYCAYCGTPNRRDAEYCIHCGRKLP